MEEKRLDFEWWRGMRFKNGCSGIDVRYSIKGYNKNLTYR